MKIFNAIAIFDYYVVAEDGEAARLALQQLIRDTEPINPSELTAREVTKEREIRTSQRDAKPFVAGDVSDKDFETLKGSTVLSTFERLYTKKPK